MITGLIQPRKWKKAFALILAALTASVGILCLTLRLLPHWRQELDATALIAAGLTLPDGAVDALVNRSSEDASEQGASSAPPVSSEGSSREAPSSTASSSSSKPETEKRSAKASVKKWTGKPFPIEEVTLQNTGVQYGNIFVKNTNDYTAVDIAGALEKRPDLSIAKDGTPQVLLYHTHTGEAYLPQESDVFYSDMPTRTEKESENVVAVGNAVEAQLKKAGIGVIHDKTIHDKSYSGSYDRSAATIEKHLKEHPTIRVTIDIHRDAMTAEDGTRYKPTVTVNGRKAAQIMIISGCDDDGTLGFPDWEYNLRLAVRLQQTCADLQESFPRPMLFCPHIYNENLTHNSLLVEFGTEVNTVEEAVYSGELFGKALVTVLEQFIP